MRRVTLLAAAIAALSSNVLAADILLPVAPAPVAIDEPESYWQGFYAGIVGGYGSGQTFYDATFAGVGAVPDPFITGALIGGTVGYNAQFGSFVLGAEGDLSWSGLRGTEPIAGFSVESRVDWVGTLRARAGVSFDQVLLFATGGLAVGGLTTSTPTIAGNTPSSSTRVGFAVGGGAEVLLTEQISIKAEYLYTDLGTRNIGTGALFGGSTATNEQTSFHAVRVGANFHF